MGRHPLHTEQENLLQRLDIEIFVADTDFGAVDTILNLHTLVATFGEFPV